MKTLKYLSELLCVWLFLSLFLFGETRKDTRYFDAGIVLGMPAFLNPVAGYYYKPLGIHISGMHYSEEHNGIQLSLTYKISDYDRRDKRLGLTVGNSCDVGSDYTYVGPVMDFYFEKLFLECGIGKVIEVRKGSFSSQSYWVIFQLGFIHKFFK